MPSHPNSYLVGEFVDDAMPFSKVPAQMTFAMRRISTMLSANHQVSVPQATSATWKGLGGVIPEPGMGLIPLPSSKCLVAYFQHSNIVQPLHHLFVDIL